ncbi:hypothetical protein TanjilG_15058 [Lupinus angustifolius]|uniref:Protein Lines C-terminal domain-containing protein n=1 Tax=Lupinus angustifolius TaxID=3871 RepID=A0A1J7FZH8_LUPAN|nr:hypothetical protein TanjilG_15058 [Lupinus angustifolius]
MSPESELSWLCHLVDESLRPYTEPHTAVSISKENENQILLNSSQVVTKIQMRIREFDSHGKDTVAKPAVCGSNRHTCDHQCLHKIVAEMVILLTVKSEFVQHVAVNALVLMSQFLSTTGNNWDGFIHMLCFFLETAISRILACSSAHSTGDLNGDFDSSDIDFLMQDGLRNCDWSTVAGITQVLHVICKGLKDDYDDKLVKVYYDSVNSCLLKVPWDLLEEYQSWDTCKEGCSMNLLHPHNFCAMEPEIKFFGTFLRLLCSLVDHTDFFEAGYDSAHKHPLLVTVINLVPRLVKWCLSNQEDSMETCIIYYLKHKLLILMIRLGSLACLDCSIRHCWLELLHNYFEELLRQPLNHFQSDQDDCLEGSPFLLSLSDGQACGMHSSHLQRQAVFLFLDCSFSMICPRGEKADHSNCSTFSSLTTKLDHFYTEKGSLELYKWTQGHLPTEISIDHEKYVEICMNFMSSFLQLYLREIHYDHQVLLDYLISKDTGISCAKYLLRCLHLICNSWKLFVNFPLFGELSNQPSCKRRKVSGNGPEFLADEMPSVENNGSIMLHIKDYKEDNEYGFEHYNINPFKKAAKCVLSLKNSVDNLHQKNLFPYNPEVLLKRKGIPWTRNYPNYMNVSSAILSLLMVIELDIRGVMPQMSREGKNVCAALQI